MNDDPPRIEVTIAAPVDAVWAALRDKNTIRHWHGWEFDGLDNEIDLIYFSHPTEDAEARTLSLQEGDVIRLEPDGDGTRVTLTRAPRGVNPEWDAYYDDITEGWTTFLNQLRFAVERKPGVPRRTVFLNSHNKSGRDLAQDLGLARRYRATWRARRPGPSSGTAPSTSWASQSTRGATACSSWRAAPRQKPNRTASRWPSCQRTASPTTSSPTSRNAGVTGGPNATAPSRTNRAADRRPHARHTGTA